ncbi:type III polyketide synthase [Nannocystis radixulma]|uniref:3-oxoacyl-[acyl-carrier-protein] synthase III C-terminal domain-containing protein n=1 Tax=Nannocystis radixulma TaxID=2995305 RepID=A0ABT5BPC8_9BACT|nr:3-oxoacyl-[acyl-carrier-protein] synthase III C-terminal domain-containing protein [Nannocystis radixulma]MDC0676003.1 3-oxoacyl-[acyl-carrier-protein] synthase III C-terminal domain-containing protein [Nannocystis radixulma]
MHPAAEAAPEFSNLQAANIAPMPWPVRPRIGGLAVARPGRSVSQDDALALFGLTGDAFAESMFARSGVHSRRLDLTPEMLRMTLQQRTEHTEEHLLAMASEAIDQLGIDPSRIGTVISSTLWSLGGPSLAHRLVERHGLRPDTDKYHIVGVGCVSAVPLIRLAAQALAADPQRQVLIVAAECANGLLTAVRADERTKIVGSALFADGCAAVLLSAGPGAGGPAVLATRVHQIPGSLDKVHVKVAGDESSMFMTRELPGIVEAQLGAVTDSFLAQQGLRPAAIRHWLVHPGGPGILEAAQRSLGLERERMSASWDVLAQHGNMGTATSLYVLHRTQQQHTPRPGDLGLMITVGPGITVGHMLLRW